MTILEAAGALRRREVSCSELTAESLKQIALLNPQLNSFLAVLESEARVSAQQADKELAAGSDRGPLHGIPVAVKDVYHMKNVRTTAGSKLFADWVAEYDFAVVEKLREAGAIIIGKTNLHELAFGITSNNPHFGTAHKPCYLDRVPGGSSGGSNLLGLPAISIVCGFNTEGPPLGLQVTAKPFEERLLLRVAAALEDAADFHAKLPPVVV
jgi:aspartyl-tRNA(Asn)/glutamyl-tRNA(Gln) amidotransferase subunit A